MFSCKKVGRGGVEGAALLSDGSLPNYGPLTLGRPGRPGHQPGLRRWGPRAIMHHGKPVPFPQIPHGVTP